MLSTKKTSSVLIAAALLGGLFVGATPAASAKTAPRMFTVTFAYNTADPAHKIYADLRGVAHRACHDRTPISHHAVKALRSCTKEVVEAMLKAMVRTDVAALHRNKNA